jgi:hypothetical protein
MIGSVAHALGNFRRAKKGVMVASVRTAIFVLLALGSLMRFGVDRASAQPYTFDFTNGLTGLSLFSFTATINNLNCNTPCTLTQPTQLTGMADIGGTNYALMFSTTSPPDDVVDNKFSVVTGVDTEGISFTTDGNTYSIYQADQPGVDGSEPVVIYNRATGTLSYSPAPPPGSGLLSYLLLGFAGLMWLWRKTGPTIDRISDAIRAKLAPKRAIVNA